MAQQPDATPDDELYGEPRWPIATAVLVFMALTLALRHYGPRRQSLGPSWLVPLVLVLLFVTLVTADPHGDRRHVLWLRRCSIVLIVLLAGAAIWSTGTLVHDLIHGGNVTNSPGTLLAVGALIWAGNNLIFSLLYWEFDSGGARARNLRNAVDRYWCEMSPRGCVELVRQVQVRSVDSGTRFGTRLPTAVATFSVSVFGSNRVGGGGQREGTSLVSVRGRGLRGTRRDG